MIETHPVTNKSKHFNSPSVTAVTILDGVWSSKSKNLLTSSSWSIFSQSSFRSSKSSLSSSSSLLTPLDSVVLSRLISYDGQMFIFKVQYSTLQNWIFCINLEMDKAWINQIVRMMWKNHLKAIQPCVKMKSVIINLPIMLGPWLAHQQPQCWYSYSFGGWG